LTSNESEYKPFLAISFQAATIALNVYLVIKSASIEPADEAVSLTLLKLYLDQPQAHSCKNKAALPFSTLAVRPSY
jgi:hypothetical protein